MAGTSAISSLRSLAGKYSSLAVAASPFVLIPTYIYASDSVEEDKPAKNGNSRTTAAGFDPEALERGAKALRELNASPYAKRVSCNFWIVCWCLIVFHLLFCESRHSGAEFQLSLVQTRLDGYYFYTWTCHEFSGIHQSCPAVWRMDVTFSCEVIVTLSEESPEKIR